MMRMIYDFVLRALNFDAYIVNVRLTFHMLISYFLIILGNSTLNTYI